MARYYYMNGGVMTGPVSARELKGHFEGFLLVTDQHLACREGSDKWVPIKSIIDIINKDIEDEMEPVRNKCADTLLTLCVVVFTVAAIVQFMAGAFLYSKGSSEIGLAFMLSIPGYIFPIAISYVLRQMFRHQLRS